MFKHLLVPIDGGELSQRAAQTSVALAQQLGARITGFVVEPFPPLPTETTAPAVYAQRTDEHMARTETHARRVLAGFEAQAVAAGVPFTGQFRRTDGVADAIVDAAAQYGCDLVVMVTHGRGAFGELLFGSQTKNVLSRSRLPLLVLH